MLCNVEKNKYINLIKHVFFRHLTIFQCQKIFTSIYCVIQDDDRNTTVCRTFYIKIRI